MAFSPLRHGIMRTSKASSCNWKWVQIVFHNDSAVNMSRNSISTNALGVYRYQIVEWSLYEAPPAPPAPPEPTTTDNMLNNVIPVLVAVVGILVIIGMAFTDTLTIESLLSVIIIAVIMIIIFGVLSGG
jgi:hypothetical protein